MEKGNGITLVELVSWKMPGEEYSTISDTVNQEIMFSV